MPSKNPSRADRNDQILLRFTHVSIKSCMFLPAHARLEAKARGISVLKKTMNDNFFTFQRVATAEKI